MKRTNIIIIAVVVTVVVLAMVGCSLTAWAEPAEGVAQETDIKIAHISDIHVMIEEYCNIYSPAYRAAGRTSYKVLEQTSAAVEAVFDEMVANAGGIPMYVVATGDLTSNGEVADHIGVARLFKAATQRIRAIPGYEGFQIFAIPGNHDIDNQGSKCYTPALDDETWNALVAEGDAQKMIDYLSDYGARPVETCTMLQFMSIYSDFGYCNCPDRKNGHHLSTCGMAEGVSLEYFYESDYWYEQGIYRSDVALDLGDKAVPYTNGYTYQYEYAVYDKDGNPSNALTEVAPTPAEIAGFKVDKDMEYYARASRHGACSYIARVGGITVLGIDANSHKWTDVKEGDDIAVQSALGWHETTGGYMTKAQLNWMTDSLRKGQDVSKHQLILALAHENVLPHFDTEDEVISLFTYDNWEDVYTNMANNGIRYVFTGHQHTNDIESDVSQAGSVFYDFETGSTTCMGAGWRELDFKQTTYADGAYAEDVWSTMHYLHYNDVVEDAEGTKHDVFAYNRYEVDDEGHYASVTVYQLDDDGNYADLADYMSLALKRMISNMAGNIVNENLMDTVSGLVGKLQGSSFDYLYPLANKAVQDLDKLNLYQFIDNKDGTFSLSAEPVAGYNLTQFAMDLVDYFLHKDYSFDKKLGVYLDDVLLYVYGNHLIGAQHADASTVPEGINALLGVLEDGTFLRYFEDLMYRGVLPEVELILNAPIYWGDSINYRHLDESSTVTADMVANGKGFDLSAEATELFARSDLYISVAKALIQPKLPDVPGIDISSLMKLVKSVPDILEPVLATLQDLGFDLYDMLGDMLGRDIGPYVDLAMGYIKKLNNKSLSLVIKEELLDKYVTDAFCVNLGSYGAYVVRSVVIDDSPDGVQRTNLNTLFPYEVQENFHVELTYAGDKSALKGHTYYRDKDGNDKVAVVATKQNGLMPSKITIGNVVDADGKLDLTKKEIRWFTQRDVDYENVCKQYEWTAEKAAAAKQFYSEMQLGTKADLSDGVITRYKGENEWIEYPTIDLGIAYFNLTYAYRQYNDFDVVLDGLQAGTTYYYRLRSVEGDKAYEWTDIYSFTTPSVSGGFEFMAMTDIQGSIEQNYIASLPNMEEALKGANPVFIVDCGDNVDKGENIAQWQWLLDDQASVWANNTLVGVVGNHEDHHYSMSYVTATPDVAVVDETGFYYSYTYQNVHFIMLNTNDVQTYSERSVDEETGEELVTSYQSLGKAQYDWLVADLDKANADSAVQFIIVALHKGPYTAGSHAFDADVIALRSQLAPLFAEKKVDVVLQGHDHTYSVSEFIGGEKDADGKYLPVSVNYDANGAAIDPDGVLYVNLGTMGDKYYNYIYSSLVTLKDRDGDAYLNATLADYMTAEGNLELSPVRNSRNVLPETPVFMYVSVQDNQLYLTSYTVINGRRYMVDSMAITKAPAKADTGIKVLGVNVSAQQLDTIASVRVPVNTPDGTELYAGYRLADVLALGGKTLAYFSYNGNNYDVADAYVVTAKADANGTLQSTTPTVVVCEDGSVLFIDADALGGGLPAWVIAVIVVAAVVAVALVVVLVLMIRKRKGAAPKADAIDKDDKGEDNE